MTSATGNKEPLINCLHGMKRKAHGAQKPRHINRIVEVASTVQRSDSPAQAINQRFHNQQGFTLLELIVVVVIIALVMGISYPSLERGSSILNLQTASRDVLNTFRFARERAISEQATMLLIVDREERKLELANILGESMRAYTLPKGINIQSMVRAGSEVKDKVMTVRFAPNGNLDNVGIRLVSDTGSRRMQIISDPLGGGARIEPVWEDIK